MHRALRIDEVLRLIFLYLECRDHYHLAFVCKGVLEPALDALWHTLEHGPDPLLRLLPENAIVDPRHASTVEFDVMVVLTRELSSNDWDRFIRHARRVRVLELDLPTAIPRNHIRYLTASLKKPGSPSPLLPNIRSLKFEIHIGDASSYEHASLFLSPSLRDFRVSDFRDEDGECQPQSFILALQNIRPPLTSLTLDIEATCLFPEALVNLFAICKSTLQVVEIPYEAAWGLIKALGQLPKLRSMSVGTCGKVQTGEVLLPSSFSSLKVIHGDVQILLKILSSVASAEWMTEVLAKDNSNPQILNALQALIDVLATSCPNITNLTLQNWDHHRSSPDLSAIPSLSFLPLRHCAKIRQFEFVSHGKLESLTDAEWAVLVRAWPQLRRVAVETARPSRATLASLDLLWSAPSGATLEYIDIGVYYPLVGVIME